MAEPVSGFARALQEGKLRLDAAQPAGASPLSRFLAPRDRPVAGERCELCAAPVPAEHAHLVEVETRNLACACRPCALLFTDPGAGRGRYRPAGSRYLHDGDFALDAAQWDALQIPVSMAFFFHNSTLDQVVAFYPSPGGATECLLELALWDDVIAANPGFADLTPDTEALLISRADDSFECFLVPIDACYELVGRVKAGWKGFAGGDDVWRDIDAFFAGLRGRSSPVVAAP